MSALLLPLLDPEPMCAAAAADLVSFTSRMIAAVRALETARPDALFADPLAAVLAGPKALGKAKVRVQLLLSAPARWRGVAL